MKQVCIINPEGKPVPILEMWESFSGWYWYITEFDKEDKDIAFGLVLGQEKEWGDIWLPELKSLGPYKVWKVPRKNWSGAKDVITTEVHK
jgi:DUF2958 family protein